MKTLRTLITAVAVMTALVFSASLMAAPCPGGKDGKSFHGKMGKKGKKGKDFKRVLEQLTDDLQLTEEQQAAAKELFVGSKEDMKSLHAEKKTIKKELHALLDADTVDLAGVTAKVEELAALKAQLTKVRFEKLIKLHELLTPEQQQTFATMKAELFAEAKSFREEMKAKMASGEKPFAKGDKASMKGKKGKKRFGMMKLFTGNLKGHGAMMGPMMGPPAKHFDKLAEKIGLDEATKTEIAAIFETSRESGKALVEETATAVDDLLALWAVPVPDSQAIMAQVDTISSIGTQLAKNGMATMVEVQSKLTPDQRAQLKEIMKQHRKGKKGMKGKKGKFGPPPEASAQPTE